MNKQQITAMRDRLLKQQECSGLCPDNQLVLELCDNAIQGNPHIEGLEWAEKIINFPQSGTDWKGFKKEYNRRPDDVVRQAAKAYADNMEKD